MEIISREMGKLLGRTCMGGRHHQKYKDVK